MVDHWGRGLHIDSVPTIRELIRAALDSGRSVRDLERDSDYQVRFQTFQELSTQNPKQFPKEAKTVAGMARALRVSPTTVVLAYAQALGIPMEEYSGFAMRLPPGADELDTEMQNALIAVVRAAVRSRGTAGDELQDARVPFGSRIRSGPSSNDARVRGRKHGH